MPIHRTPSSTVQSGSCISSSGKFDGRFCRLYLHTKTTGLFMNMQDDVMIEKVERLSELYRQQWESGYASPLREFGSKAVPTESATELEVSEEFVALSM